MKTNEFWSDGGDLWNWKSLFPDHLVLKNSTSCAVQNRVNRKDGVVLTEK